MRVTRFIWLSEECLIKCSIWIFLYQTHICRADEVEDVNISWQISSSHNSGVVGCTICQCQTGRHWPWVSSMSQPICHNLLYNMGGSAEKCWKEDKWQLAKWNQQHVIGATDIQIPHPSAFQSVTRPDCWMDHHSTHCRSSAEVFLMKFKDDSQP